jgi:hypothetical protein
MVGMAAKIKQVFGLSFLVSGYLAGLHFINGGTEI